MIAVYAVCHVKADKIAEFEKVVKALVAASRNDQGCVTYGCGVVQGKDNVYTFIEQWRSQEDLALHSKQPHFAQAVSAFSDLLSRPIEINVVDLI